jgi:putative transcriptional regulator
MTDTIKHHITDDILMAYSAGALPEAFSLLVATHVSLCDTCRAQLHSFDAVGGAILEAGQEPVSEDSLAATLAMIAAEPKDETALHSRPLNPGVLPGPLQDYVGGDLDAIRWRPVGMGVKQAILSTSKEASARLLYIPAGSAVPDHGHHGIELTMVLQGAFSDEDGRFVRGDVETADSNVEHTPIAEPGEDCICLAVTDAPLKFRGLLPRIAQPFLRI